MATVAVLNVGIRANTRQFSLGLKSVAAQIMSLRGLFAGIGAAGLVYMGKRALETTDQLGETAQKLGMTAESFSRLEYAASQSGVAVESMGANMQQLSRRLAEVATTGKGQAASALDRLQLSAKDLLAAQPEQRMMMLAQAFQGVNSQAERLAIAYDLFGKQGSSMVNLFGEGADNMSRLFEEADKLGITVSQLDVSRAAILVDLGDKLKRIWQSIIRIIAVSVAPLFIAAGEMILEWIASTNNWGESLSSWLFKAVQGFAELGRVSEFVKAVWGRLLSVFYELRSGLMELLASIMSWWDEDFARALQEQADVAAKKAIDTLIEADKQWKAAFDPKNSNVEAFKSKLDEINQRAQEAAKRAREAAGAAGEAVPDLVGKPSTKEKPAIEALVQGSAEEARFMWKAAHAGGDVIEEAQLQQQRIIADAAQAIARHVAREPALLF